MAKKKTVKTSAKRKGPVSVADLKKRAKTKAAPAAVKGATAGKKTARDAYRFVSENLQKSKKKLPLIDLSVLEQVQDKLLNLLLEAFNKQHGTPGNKRDFRLMRREWLRRRLAELAPVKKIGALSKKIRNRRRSN